ncbi:MAG: NAD-dependent epimerase/dehydratase family protein [Opitutae bacterium]|nr:NAD-dependent epimerase/dehydratase family protein [Opitutae bacterium]
MNSMPAAPHSPPIILTGARGCLAGVIARHFTTGGASVIRYSRTGGGEFRPLAELVSPAGPPPAGTLLHLAWSTLPFNAEQQPADTGAQDLELLERILRRCAAAPVRPHFIFFSSGGTVYGNAHGGRPSTEEDPCHPISRHGRATLAAEQLVQRFGREHGLSWTILRISNPYGFDLPLSRPQGIIPVALHCAWEGRPLTLWGDGTARKDFLHCTDFNQALGKIVERRLPGIFNVSSGHSHTIRELIALIEQATGCRLVTRHEPAHTWDVHDSLLDNSKLCAATGWRPVVPLAEGIRRVTAELGRP